MSSIETAIEMVIENEQAAPKIVGIVCHPHPLHGGTMNNKVVTTLTRVIREFGGTAIRFNYRKFDHGIGELQDTLEIIQLAKQKWPQADIWLAGFSYGAYISLKAATQIKNLKQLISIAPAVNNADFSGLHPHCPWTVVIAEADEVVPAQDIKNWIKTLSPTPEVITFENTSHFFHSKLIDLRDTLIASLKNAHPL
ncbi:MAG TPA: alpha/beta hydrolase [Gammaproteobacteria bacterium]|nr:alpha/beta hydrolase [Gammaproteobacteria bacterium]